MSNPPPSSWPCCPKQLSEEQIASFRDQGFLAFRNAFTPDELATARARLSELVERVVAKAKQSDDPTVPCKKYLTEDGGRFGVQFEKGTDYRELTGMDLELKIRKLMWYCDADEFFAHQTIEHPRIQGVLRGLIGENPVLFQDMALVKPPRIGSIKPWHQDNAYFTVLPLDAVVGVWIALDDATIENGCMHVIPSGHQAGARRHYHDRDCEIVPDRIDESEAVPIELPAGGVLFFYGMLPHQTPPNRSAQRRRALQWHYHAADAQSVSPETFDEVFAEPDGTPASCQAAGRRSKSD